MNRYIVTSPKDPSLTESTEGFIITRHYQCSLENITDLYEEAKKSFPDLTPEIVEFGAIRHSSWCKGCLFIRFPLPTHTKNIRWNSVAELPNTIP